MILLRIVFPKGRLMPPTEVLNEMATVISQSAGECPVRIIAEQGKGEGTYCSTSFPFYPILVLYDRELNKKPKEIEEMVAKSLEKAPLVPEEENRSLAHFLISATPARKALVDFPWPGWA